MQGNLEAELSSGPNFVQPEAPSELAESSCFTGADELGKSSYDDEIINPMESEPRNLEQMCD